MLVFDGQEYLRAMWFNQPFMRDKFKAGQHVLLSAKPRFRGGRWEMPHPRVTWLDGEEDQPEMRLLPLYPLTEGLSQYQMRRMVATAVERFGPVLEEVFPEAMLAELDLMPLAEALRRSMRRRMRRSWPVHGGDSCFRSCSCCSWRSSRGGGSSGRDFERRRSRPRRRSMRAFGGGCRLN